jgi:TDG/mug DNA glycosylase family protein
VPMPTAAALEAARGRTVPDVLPGSSDPPLRLLLCGINPGLVTAATGHHFARPGNRFWPMLHGAGLTPRLLAPAEQDALVPLGIGITNLVPRTTATAAELTRAELRAGGERLRDLVVQRSPAWLAVLGVTAYRTALREPKAQIGPQPEPWGSTRVWVLPNPSGLNAGWSSADLVAECTRLREALDAA